MDCCVARRVLLCLLLARSVAGAQWFGAGTDGVDVHQWDLEPGGLWRATMRYQGNDMPWSGRFHEIDEPERLVWAFIDAGSIGDTFEVMTMTLTEDRGETELVLRQSGGSLSDEEYGRAKEGTGGFLDALELKRLIPREQLARLHLQVQPVERHQPAKLTGESERFQERDAGRCLAKLSRRFA